MRSQSGAAIEASLEIAREQAQAVIAANERNKEIRRILGHDERDIELGVTTASEGLEIAEYKMTHPDGGL